MQKYFLTEEEHKKLKKYEDDFSKTIFGKKAKLWLFITYWFGLGCMIGLIAIELIAVLSNEDSPNMGLEIIVLFIDFICMFLAYLIYQCMLMNFVNSKNSKK